MPILDLSEDKCLKNECLKSLLKRLNKLKVLVIRQTHEYNIPSYRNDVVFTNSVIEVLVNNPDMKFLKSLSLINCNSLYNEKLAGIVNSPHIKLEELYLDSCTRFSDEVLIAIANSPHASHLRKLSLVNLDGVSESGIQAILTSPHMANLSSITLRNNRNISPSIQNISPKIKYE